MADNASPGARYRRWLRYIAKDHPTLDGLNRGMLLSFAWMFADKGDNGLNCYTGNEKIADQLESTRGTIKRYKNIAIDAGWFTDTGRKVGRSQVYNISIPAHDPRAAKKVPRKRNTSGLKRGKAQDVKLSEPTPTPADDDPWTFDAPASSRPVQTVSAPSRRSSGPAVKHVGTADPPGVAQCPACAPMYARYRADRTNDELFNQMISTHALAG